MLTIIAMDGDGNVDFRDGQEFVASAAEAECARMNIVAEREGSDWYYMTLPADHGRTEP